MRKIYLIAICGLATFTLLVPASHAQTPKRIDLGSATRLDQLPEWRRRELLWTQQPWTGDDRPYVRIRQTIDKAVASGQDVDTVIARYRPAAMSKPQDARAVFGWAYAAWNARKRFFNSEEQSRRIALPSYALLRAPFPRTYQFARLLFLTQARDSAYGQFLIGVGDKLLRRNPQDDEVKLYLAKSLAYLGDAAKRQRSLRLTRELIAHDGRRANYYSLLGGIYFQTWEATKRRADANSSIAAYQHYLQLAPASDDWRPRAHMFISLLQKNNG